MSLVAEAQQRPAAAVAESDERPIIHLGPMAIGVAVLCVFYIALRAYEQFFATRIGELARMDFYSPFFYRYWLSPLYVVEPVELLAFLAVVVYLWRTRDRDVANVEPREELRRTIFLLAWLLVYSIAIFWAFSFFGEQEATWIQANVRDSAFTPTSIAQFYLSYPIFIIIGAGGFLYARTRLPAFACRGFSVAYVALFFGPLMLLPSVALNEWGSSVWVLEELFVAPLHWTFVFFGWSVLFIFGVSLQILGRIVELCGAQQLTSETQAAE